MAVEIPQRQCLCNLTDERRVDRTESLHNIVKARLYPYTTYQGSIDELRPLVFETMRQLLIDYPCHLCNWKGLNMIFDVVRIFAPNLLCIGFVTQTVINVCSNENILNWAIVWVILIVIKKFLQIKQDVAKKKKLVNDIALLPMARMLVARLVAETNYCHEMLAEHVLDILTIAFNAKPLRESDYEQLADDLIKSFPFHPHKVFSIMCSTIESMSPNEPYCKFWNDFATGVHEVHRLRWQSDEIFAYEYALVLVKFEMAFESKSGYKYCLARYNDTALVEVLRQNNNIIPNRLMVDFLMKVGPLELTTTEVISGDVIDLFFEKISRVSTIESVKLHHEAQQLETEARKKLEKKLRDQVYESDNLSFLDQFVECAHNIYPYFKFDFRHVKLFITLANFDNINITVPYYNIISDIVICNREFYKNHRGMLESGIPQTIWGVINNLHENCSLCKETVGMMRKLARSIRFEIPGIVYELSKTKNAKLAALLPYVLPAKTLMIQAMCQDGFDLLMDQLEQGEDFESLNIIAKICRDEPPFNWETVSCTFSNQQVIDAEGTKVFVLDKGTKIRAKTSPLIKNSQFFAQLLAGKFAEASLEEIRLRDVTSFQFHFIVEFIAHAPWPKGGVNFDMGVQEHVDLITVCDKLCLETLCASLMDSLRWHHMDAKLLAEESNVRGFYYGLPILRKICVDFVLKGDAQHTPNMESLRYLIQNIDRNLLLEDIRKWIDSDLRTVEAQSIQRPVYNLNNMAVRNMSWADWYEYYG